MRLMDSNLIKSKFHGSLLGALMGDCLGAPFEGEIFDAGHKLVLKQYFDKLEGPYFKNPIKTYTDDTAMTKCVLRTLIDRNEIDQKDLARNFVREFYSDPKRGYGGNVVDVFARLRKTKCEDPTAPAHQQFNGSGSFGNGAAMRIAPVGLFCLNKSLEELIKMSTLSAEITHTNKLAVDGAILQALAVHQSLHMNPADEFNAKEFITELIGKIDKAENDLENLGVPIRLPYNQQLQRILYFLDNPERAHDTGIIEGLGNSIAALHSVPTAIYSFIRGHDNIEGIPTQNPFRRTLHYAISLGGDTDTIASMAGAICGAYHGCDIIDKNLKQHCEAIDEIESLANQLFDLAK